MQVGILVLAAGASRRMRGADKLLELIDGVPLLRVQVLRALATGHNVYVTLPDLDGLRARSIADLDVTRVPVPTAADGMSVSLKAGLAAIPDSHAILICLPDLVEIETSDLHTLLQAKDDAPAASIWRAATEDGKPGHPIVISPSLRPAFAALEGDTGGASVLQSRVADTELVPLPGQRARRDLDTPEDWAAWRARSHQTS